MKLNEVLNQFLLDCEIRGRTGYTLKWYAQRIGLFIRVMLQECGVSELEEVKIGHLRQFVQLLLGTKAWANSLHVATQERNLSPITVRGYVRAVKRFFRWCVDEELLSSSPASRLAQPKAPAYLTPAFTPEHIEKMLGRCDLNTPLGFRDYVLLLLLLDTGMRVSELCNLKVSDVHDRYVKVFGKGRKEREIGIHPEVSKLLWKYIHKYRKPDDPTEMRVFLGRGGTPLSVPGVEELLRRVKHESGLEGMKVSPHVFRHTFAKMYLEQGGEVFKLSREMGHSQVQVTEIYLKDFHSTEARQEHTQFSPIEKINLKGKKRNKQNNNR